MKWLDRLRQKNREPLPAEVPKVPKAPDKFSIPLPAAVPKVPKAPSVTFGTPSGVGCEILKDRDEVSLPRPQERGNTQEEIRVSYQRIYFDWNLADGTYTPEQLRKTKLVVKPWGEMRTYPLVWTGGRRSD
jgi:hypothetical protein